MSILTGTRPTPQSLPKLRIPSDRHKPEPEEITTSRVVGFLEFCRKHKKAPLTRLPSLPLVLPPPEVDSESDTDGSENKAKCKDNKNIEKDMRNLAIDSPLDTLAFTEHEWVVLEAKRKEYEHAKAQHADSILEMQADKRDRKLMEQCRFWRHTREQLNLEIALIMDRRQIRRNFRRDANNPPGLENW
ncbi:hypothetical protein F4804DRAFT_293106 [Jackrogersella minutella]|nr:hypothetical protein F4804DRAFT_293106 [Jackrogersella minutella]